MRAQLPGAAAAQAASGRGRPPSSRYHHRGARRTDHAHAFAALLRQPRERVFTERTRLGDAMVTALLRLTQWLAGVNVSTIALALEFGFTRAIGIGAVGTDRPAGAARV
ncbi:hypothetical protein G7069_08855 [Lysobacter sp. HDW10]|uniref:hypothetical protein n=1 Tax=Lysobacter sp. HDW10 TaxID=2714936 RepID=UPI00140DDE41|nr:hypothetical protein [Lysobacter sp. HDW10]QIK81694.1 hypothetical protein G7069_08855 [Lysobacter sp. HDW10]